MISLRWKIRALIALCLVLAVYAFGLVYEGFIATDYHGVFTWPFVDEAAAWRAYARMPSNVSIKERETIVRRLELADPADPQTWNAVSATEFLKAGNKLSPKAIEALDHSYAVSFFDRVGGAWRIGFALDNWKDIPEALRGDVLTEMKVMLKDPYRGGPLRERLKAVQSPEGRLVVALTLGENGGK